MSRTAVVAFVLTLLILGRAAFAEPCNQRVQGYNIDADTDDSMKPETRVSVGDIEDWSNDSGYQGILVQAPAGARLKISFFKSKAGPAFRNVSLALRQPIQGEEGLLKEHKNYLPVAEFNPRRIFRGDAKFFSLAIENEAGEPVCSGGYLPIRGGH